MTEPERFCCERIVFGPCAERAYLGTMGELIDIGPKRPDRPGEPERLWREMLGAQLRELRRKRGLTLVQTARRAGISPQYLSEIERGLKDPSSEILAAITGALDFSVLDVTTFIVADLRAPRSVGTSFRGPVALAA
jgi:DNA-binding XRE family transcriptional regulator